MASTCVGTLSEDFGGLWGVRVDGVRTGEEFDGGAAEHVLEKKREVDDENERSDRYKSISPSTARVLPGVWRGFKNEIETEIETGRSLIFQPASCVLRLESCVFRPPSLAASHRSTLHSSSTYWLYSSAIRRGNAEEIRAADRETRPAVNGSWDPKRGSGAGGGARNQESSSRWDSTRGRNASSRTPQLQTPPDG
jgi:hypothetical protein